MTGLDAAGFAAYARQQVLAADVILTGHYAQGPMCSCGRLMPCPHALAVRQRRAYFAARLAHHAPAVGRASVPNATSAS